MSASEWIEIAAGIAIIALVLYDIFSAVVVPRSVPRGWRIAGYVVPTGWVLWRNAALRVRDAGKREDILAGFAPAVLVVLLVLWLVLLIFGYALVLHGLRASMRPPLENFAAAYYLAGTSLLTIGFGDYVPMEPAARFVTLAAASTGLGLFALDVTFIFSIFGSFQQREVFIGVMGSRAGSPPSGVTLLETIAKYNLAHDVADDFRDAERWASMVLESHLAYPILAYFRSSHDDESWVGTVGALLDATTMVITLTNSEMIGRAKLLRSVCVHLTRDLSRYFRVDDLDNSVGIERREFDQACAQLTAAGVPVRCDDAAWEKFSELRRQYAGPLNALARYWAIPRTLWVGDRSPLKRSHMKP